jgi:signal transduction histidine kinase
VARQLVFETLDGRILEESDWPSQRLLRGESIQSLELLLRRRDKVWSRILSYNGSPVRGADGSVRLVMATFTDITQRKQAEAAMLQSQRMESLGTLAAGIAHDFNNLLLAISGNAALASAELDGLHPARESLAEVVRASQRASDLVKRILLFARAEDARRVPGDLRPVVEEALKLLRPTVPAGIRVRAAYAAELGAVNMDSSQIHQVVVNLITNAVHAIEAGSSVVAGEISVELKPVDLAESTVIGDQKLKAGAYVCLAVTDNGCGMEPTIVSRIFDPFFTTKPVGQGTGLGLPMVHGIVQDHGGAVAVTSRAGTGTQMLVYLPAVPGGEAAPVHDEGLASGGRGQHVLYLDDEEALVFLVTRYLRKLGYAVAGFSKPTAAVAEFLAHPDLYDVVVTDLSMPGMSGFDVARTIRAVKPDIPIILMSGFVRPEDHVTAESVGVTQVLLKPSTVDDLGWAIHRELN